MKTYQITYNANAKTPFAPKNTVNLCTVEAKTKKEALREAYEIYWGDNSVIGRLNCYSIDKDKIKKHLLEDISYQ